MNEKKRMEIEVKFRVPSDPNIAALDVFITASDYTVCELLIARVDTLLPPNTQSVLHHGTQLVACPLPSSKSTPAFCKNFIS
jgi:hypothetical protein